MHHDLTHRLTESAHQHGVPGAALVVVVDGQIVVNAHTGMARLAPPEPVTSDQVWDLASVTKALAGATVTAALVERGTLSLDTIVADWLPQVDLRVRLRHLLQHSSGYPAWLPLYELVTDAWGSPAARSVILEAARRAPLVQPPGHRHLYSDIGFLVLCSLLEEAGGARLDELFDTLVARPFQAGSLSWGWPGAAASEDCPVRGQVVQGLVHDLNCSAMGGISTHAGLFGTAKGVAELADALRVAATTLSELPSMAAFWSEKGPGSHRCGWDGVSRGGYTSTGRWFPDDAVGHLGYTGTSIWVVPSRRTTVALLTNRVHPRDHKAGIRALRPVIHDAVATALGWDRDST